MKPHRQKYLPLLIGFACAIGVLIGSFLNFPKRDFDLFSSNENKQKLSYLIDYLDYDYVDYVNTDSIVDLTIANILSNLDPHSTYISKTRYEEVSETLEGDFIGIGIQFFQVDDTMAVIRTLEEGPGRKQGILPGDRVLFANDIALYGQGMDLDSLKRILKGESNTSIDLKIQRKEREELLAFKVTREHIPLKSVNAALKLNNDIGYIKLNRFTRNTSAEFKSALDKLKKEGATDNLILDLRDNGGGYLKEAIRVVEEFLEKDTRILLTKNKRGEVKETRSKKSGEFKDSNVYVILNENSASASEIVAGALQDNDVGTIVGQRSYGKGLVQREMDLGDGSAVRLTVAKYYTPTGRSIQRPYKDQTNAAYHKEYIRRYHNGEMQSRDSIPVNDSLKYTTPGGKTVYGGGGIIPDIFIPKEVSYKRESLDYMLKGGLIDRFVFNKMDENRAYYNKLTYKEFESEIVITDQILEEFLEFLGQYHLNFDMEEYYDILKTYVKAKMAHQLFNTETYERIIIEQDQMIQKTTELVQQDIHA